MSFEGMLGNAVCETFGSFKSGGHSYFWREPAVRQSDGKANGGAECPEAPSRIGHLSRGNSFPDFLVTPVRPQKITKEIDKMSWLIAEAKLSGNNIKTSGRRANQLKAILKHSQHWSALRVVLYISFNEVRKSKVRKLKRLAATYNSKLFLFSIR